MKGQLGGENRNRKWKCSWHLNTRHSTLGMALKEPWLIDSGATKHMTPCREMFYECMKQEKPEPVTLGDGKSEDAIRIGRVKVRVQLIGKPID